MRPLVLRWHRDDGAEGLRGIGDKVGVSQKLAGEEDNVGLALLQLCVTMNDDSAADHQTHDVLGLPSVRDEADGADKKVLEPCVLLDRFCERDLVARSDLDLLLAVVACGTVSEDARRPTADVPPLETSMRSTPASTRPLARTFVCSIPQDCHDPSAAFSPPS